MLEAQADATVFSWPVRVYWEDTDAGGIVYHADYLRFMERARSEWMRARGMDQQAFREATGLGFVVRDISIEYLAAGRLDDALEVTVQIARRRRASLVFEQLVRRPVDAVDLARARVRVVCVELGRMRPVPLPDIIVART